MLISPVLLTLVVDATIMFVDLLALFPSVGMVDKFPSIVDPK